MGSPVCNMSQMEGTRVWREELEQIKIVRENNKTVFDTLESYFTDKTKFDVELDLEIYSGIRTTGTLYFKGKFSISDSELDPELTTFEIKLRLNDDYYDIFEKYDVQYEVDADRDSLNQLRIGYSEQVILNATWTNGLVGTAFSTLVASSGSVSTAVASAGGTSDAAVSFASVSTGDVVIVNVFEKTGVVPIEFDIVNAIPETVTQEAGQSLTSTGELAFTISKYVGIPYVNITSDPGTTAMEFTVRKISNDNDLGAAAELLMDFLEEFVTDYNYMYLTGYTGKVLSTFFRNDALPSDAPSTISTFITANSNGNYVTEDTTNELNYTMVGLLRQWFVDAEETSYKLSFKDLTDHLRDIFQVYWYVDADGNIRFEHERYFVNMVSDSTPITVPAYAEVDKRKLKYEKGLIASVEQFKWPQCGYYEFMGRDIIYNYFETTNNTKVYSISHITTDMRYVIDSNDSASNSGLGLYNCNLLTGMYDKGDGTNLYEIAITEGELTSVELSNAAFAWPSLHDKYWRWSRMAYDATMNSTAVTMESSIRFLHQEGVRFHYATAISPYTAIDTTLTGGAPITVRRDLDTDTVEILISYDPYKL